MPHQSTQDPGEQEARQERFLALLDPVYHRLENFAFAMEHDRDSALDLVGETVLRAWERFDSLSDPAAFLSWLLTTATRIRSRRQWRRRLFGDYDEHYAQGLRSDSGAPDLSADVAALYGALTKLPAKQREAIVLHEITGLPLKEIVAIQGGTLSALKVRLFRARRELSRLLGASEEPAHEIDAGTGKTSSKTSPNILPQ